MTWRPPLPPFPFTTETAEIADWAELSVAATGERLGRGKLQTTMAREDAGDAIKVADVWSELSRRSEIFGRRWPYRLDSQGLNARPVTKTFPLHVFLTALGMRTNIDSTGRELFEHVVAEVIRAMIGNHTVRLGSPRRPPVATSLSDAVREYFNASAEESAILRPFPTTDGDLGLDVAGWMTFDDTRGGYLHFVGQCATGADWYEKLLDLNIHKWNDHVNWSVPPVRFFALPFVVRHDEFRRVTLDGGLIFDRPRLMTLATRGKLSASIGSRIRKYCTEIYS